MNLNFPQLLIGAIGAILIMSAIKGETPVQIIKDALADNQKPTNAVTTPGVKEVKPIPNSARFKD
jgi:hypothetical protein